MTVRVYLNTNGYDYKEVTDDIVLDTAVDIREELQYLINDNSTSILISYLSKSGKNKIKKIYDKFPVSFDDPCYTFYGIKVVQPQIPESNKNINTVYILVTEYDNSLPSGKNYEINGVYYKREDAENMKTFMINNKNEFEYKIVNQTITEHIII